jgi:hypothetical protein
MGCRGESGGHQAGLWRVNFSEHGVACYQAIGLAFVRDFKRFVP